MAIREQADNGRPTVIAEPDGPIAMLYQQLARKVGARLARQAASATAMPSISISED
ncbi:antiporter inner membrane protein [compost metagenome]